MVVLSLFNTTMSGQKDKQGEQNKILIKQLKQMIEKVETSKNQIKHKG